MRTRKKTNKPNRAIKTLLKEVVQLNSFRLCKSALVKPAGSERRKDIQRQKSPNKDIKAKSKVSYTIS